MLAGKRRMREEAELAESIVERHDYDAALGEIGAVVELHGRATVHECPTIDPHHHRQLCGGRGVRGPDIERQAIFALLETLRVLSWNLRADRPKICRIARAGPVRRRLRRAPAKIAYRRGCERNAPEHLYAVFRLAVEDALIDPDRDFGGERRRGSNQGNKKGAHTAAQDDHSG